MKALVCTEYGETPQMHIEERDIPQIKPGYSLVKVHAATINPLSNLIRKGMVPHSNPPRVLSNDGSGTVEQSETFEVGTRVAIYGGAQLGITEDGMQQQWVLVEDKRLIKLPDNFSLDAGAALPINYVTAYQALSRIGHVQAGQTVLISGASGAVGHALIQMTLALGATPVAVVSTTAKVANANKSGAKTVIDLSRQNLLEEVMRLTNNKGADIAFDPVGGEVFGQLVKALCLRGAIVAIGFVGGTHPSFDVSDLVVQEKRILGYDAWLESDEDVARSINALRGFIQDGLLEPVIDSTYPLSQYVQGYERLNSRKATGTLLLRVQE